MLTPSKNGPHISSSETALTWQSVTATASSGLDRGQWRRRWNPIWASIRERDTQSRFTTSMNQQQQQQQQQQLSGGRPASQPATAATNRLTVYSIQYTDRSSDARRPEYRTTSLHYSTTAQWESTNTCHQTCGRIFAKYWVNVFHWHIQRNFFRWLCRWKNIKNDFI